MKLFQLCLKPLLKEAFKTFPLSPNRIVRVPVSLIPKQIIYSKETNHG